MRDSGGLYGIQCLSGVQNRVGVEMVDESDRDSREETLGGGFADGCRSSTKSFSQRCTGDLVRRLFVGGESTSCNTPDRCVQGSQHDAKYVMRRDRKW